MNFAKLKGLVEEQVAINAVKLRPWGSSWRALGPGEYADMVTRVAHPNAPLAERKKTQEWKATRRVHAVVDRATERYAKECRPLTQEDLEERAQALQLGRPVKKLCEPAIMFGNDVEADYKAMHAAIKHGDTSALTESQKMALRDLVEAGHSYSLVHRAFESGGHRLRAWFPAKTLAAALGFDADDFEEQAKEDLRILIRDEERSLAKIKSRPLNRKSARDMVVLREAGIQRYYDELRRIELRHEVPLEMVRMSRDWP